MEMSGPWGKMGWRIGSRGSYWQQLPINGLVDDLAEGIRLAAVTAVQTHQLRRSGAHTGGPPVRGVKLGLAQNWIATACDDQLGAARYGGPAPAVQ